MNKLFYIFSLISFYATCMQKPDESFYDSLKPIVDTRITPPCYEHIPSNSSYSSFDEISFSLTRSILCSPEEDEPFSEVITTQSIPTKTLSLASCSTAPKVFICKALGCKYVCNYQGCLFQSNNIPTIYAHSMKIHQTRYIPSPKVQKLVVKTIKPYLMKLNWEFRCTKCEDFSPTPTSMQKPYK